MFGFVRKETHAHRCRAAGTNWKDRVWVDLQDKRVVMPCSREIIAGQASQQRLGVLVTQVNAFAIAFFGQSDCQVIRNRKRPQAEFYHELAVQQSPR